jgi:hypothetical protein
LISNSSYTTQSTYKGKVAYYAPKSFEVIATNLNNYIKINDVKATPKYGTSVVPFADGHHITISDEGITTVDIEDGSEGSYTTYYCIVDSELPTIDFTYYNSNATTNRKTGTIKTNSNGSKSQTIYEGVFRNQVQLNYSYSEEESPESATYTYNGVTKTLTSGMWLKDEGDYSVTITDLAGNSTTYQFSIDNTSPSYNLNRLISDTNYKITKWYNVSIPYGYTGYGTYSFKTYENALNYACSVEKANVVTKYTLSDVNDFSYTNMIANGDTVKVGDYFYYKSKTNENLYVYYFSEDLLNEAIEYYASKYVSDPIIYKSGSLSTNTYGTSVDNEIYDNIIYSNDVEAYLVNDFIFKTTDDNESYKIYYKYVGDNSSSWSEFAYNKTFASQVSSSGLYQIKEVDFVGNETTYYVFLDSQAPLLEVEAKIYGKDKTITQVISSSDIPNNGELIFYYESFKINNVIEDDKWWVLEVKNSSGKITRYTYLDEYPNFDEFGSGEYKITIFDRNDNKFTFTLCLLGVAPEVSFTTNNANTELNVKITNKDSFNLITDLKIYRNNVCLNSDNGYDEYPDDDTNSLIYISIDTTKYTFHKGGIYVVEVTDTFGRTLTYEYKFEKDIPTGVLTGVEHNGRTNSSVTFAYDTSKYFVTVTQNEKVYTANSSLTIKISTLTFEPIDDSEFVYVVTLYDLTDTENYNIYSFTIKTIKPVITLCGVENGSKTGGNVYAIWENADEQYTSTYTLNGVTNEYKKGLLLTSAGLYQISLFDELGNVGTATFEIDKSIDFVIADVSGNTYSVSEIDYINFDIRIVPLEELFVEVLYGKNSYDYEFNSMITEEGTYYVTLKDVFNNSYYFSFTIDKTAPEATLYGVENYGITNNRAWVTSRESNLTCWYAVDNTRYDYKLGTELKQTGNYIVYVADKAKNITTFEFTIDRGISYDINIYYGGVSNGGVRIIAYENLKIVMYKDEQKIDYTFEQILNDEGIYSFTLVDDYGNKESFYFQIITKKQQSFRTVLQTGIVAQNIKKNDEDYDFVLTDGELYLYDEGEYQVTIFDESENKNYTFTITIDTTAPTLEIEGVENGGSTKNNVVLKNISESPYELNITVDGVNFEYKLGDKIEKSGYFVVTLKDEAGNSTTYTFTKEYSLNGPSIAVLAGLGVLVVLLIILLVKSRHRYYQNEVVEEVETTTTIDDLDNGGDDIENPNENDEDDENIREE